MKVIMKKDQRMGLGWKSTQTAQNIEDSSNRILFMDTEYFSSLMARNTRDSGGIIRCMDLVFSHGQMDVFMRASTKTI
jgi:hypothetical protein